MKRLSLLTMMLFFVFVAGSAQNISVKSFRLLETDLTANLEGSKEIDQNGEVAALIKVITTETGFLFDVGMLGIVKQEQKPGEIWLYVPHGIQRISINHQKLGRLAEPYYFPIPIVQARTYELELTTSRVKTIVEEDAGGGFLTLKVTPPSAIVFVDDQAQTLNANGSVSTFLLYGEHTYRIEAMGYESESGTMNISSEETQTVTVTLRSKMARISLSVPMNDAEIWINNELKGVGQWTGELPAGAYVFETRKESCRPQRTTVTLAEKEERTMTLQDPEPVFGRLRAESNPPEAEVWLGTTKLGTTPGIFGAVPVGTHSFLFMKDGYENLSVEATIEEGKIAAVSATLTAASTEPDQSVTPSKKTSTAWSISKTGFYAGTQIAMNHPSSVELSGGLYWGGLNLEGYIGFVIARGNNNVTWHYLDDNGTMLSSFTQTYNPLMHLGLNLGYGFVLGNRFRVTPQAGVDVLNISADAVGPNSNAQETYVFSGTASLKVEYAITRLLALTLSPGYSFPIKRGETVDQLFGANTKFSQWNNGFTLKAGICLNF